MTSPDDPLGPPRSGGPAPSRRRRALLRSGLGLGLAASTAGTASTAARAAGPAPTGATATASPLAEPAPPVPVALPPGMRQPGAPFSGYGQPAAAEREVVRRIGANRSVPGNGVSWTPLEDLDGMLTPAGLHFERHHNGVPAIDPAEHRLWIHGRVRQPLRFDLASLLRYPRVSRMLVIECGGNSNAGWHAEPIQRPVGSFHGLVSCSEWSGVPLGLLFDEAGVEPGADWVIAEGADAIAMNVSLPLAKLREDGFVALFQNGERLRPEQGYPLRLIVPGWEGVLHVKWLHRLQLADQPAMARNETVRYTEPQPDGTARAFTWVLDVKSLITTPTHGQRLTGPGPQAVTGLAWSGRGRIARVEVSSDGGRQWTDARLDGPVLPQCWTRFRHAWHWDGRESVLQSRATDESGQVQPTRAALVAARGRVGYFHYHAIVSWAVDDDGTVRHVYA